MAVAYKKWNSILKDFDIFRGYGADVLRRLCSSGCESPVVVSTTDIGYAPGPGVVALINNVSAANTFRMGNTYFNCYGFFCPIFDHGNAGGGYNIFTVPAPPGSGSRTDFVFLEIWRQVVGPSDPYYKYGDVDGQVEFVSQDDYLLQLRWRFRVVTGVDFNTYPSGFAAPGVKAQGPLSSPSSISFSAVPDDSAVFRAVSVSFGVFDDVVYAIPLLRVNRTAGVSVVTNVVDFRSSLFLEFEAPSKDHGSQHISTGEDPIPLAVSGGPSGLLSGVDKAKLDSVSAGAEPNQNAFSAVKVGTANIAADSETAVLELVAGTGVSLVPDVGNRKVTLSVSMSDVVHGERGGGTLHSVASSESSGFMSIAMFNKLASVQIGAEPNQPAFSAVLVGGTSLQAEVETDSFELAAGANISLVLDAGARRITIAGTGKWPDSEKLDGKEATDFLLLSGGNPAGVVNFDANSAGRLVLPVGADQYAT